MERANLENGDYRYVTEHSEGSPNPILSMTGEKVNVDRSLHQFSKVLASLNANKQHSAIDELL